MQENITKERIKELQTKSRTFISKLLFDKEYVESEYDKELEKIKLLQKKPYTACTDAEIKDLIEIVINGYAGFGLPFITKLIDFDKELAGKMFEAAIQQVLDLNYSLSTFQKNLETALSKQEINIPENHISTKEGE